MASWFDSILDQLTDDPLKTAVSLGGSYLLNKSGIGQAQIPQTGYQGKIPELSISRQVVPNTYDPNRRPGSGGQRYFTDAQYTPKSATPAVPMTADGLASLNAANPAQEEIKTVIPPAQQMAAGGIAELFGGSFDAFQGKSPKGSSLLPQENPME